MEALQRQQAARLAQRVGPLAPPRPPPPPPPRPSFPGTRTLQAPEGGLGKVGAEEEEDAQEDEEGEEAGPEDEAAEGESHPGTQDTSSPSSQPPGPHPHEWTYEEQFKQVGPSQHQGTSPFLLSGQKQGKVMSSPPTPTAFCRIERQRHRGLERDSGKTEG